MGMILLKYGLRTKRIPLLEVNGFGRNPEFGLRSIPVKNLPMFWLEIRWMSGQWVWRVLNSEEDTRGKGGVLPHGWRNFQDRLYFQTPNTVLIELFDDRPPEVMVESLSEGNLIPVSEFVGLHIGQGGYRAEREGELLGNGSIFVVENKAYRLWIPQNYAPSIESSLQLSDPRCHLDLYPQTLKAVFSMGHNRIELQGEHIRVLWMYAVERLHGEGWIDATTAQEAWIELGGNESSEIARISWERNKLRKLLLEQNALGVDHLFGRYRQGAAWFHRLNLEPSQITVMDGISEP